MRHFASRSKPSQRHQRACIRKACRSARRCFGLEPLDARILLTGDIFVTILHDVNGNGVKDPEEPALADWEVYVDLNRNEIHDEGEPLAVTDIDGEAFITGLAEDTYDVIEILPLGWAPTPGFNARERVSVKDGEEEAILFLNVTSENGSIEGTVWNDLNGDGLRSELDLGLPGWTVFLDLNNDNVIDPLEPSVITDANGHYLFLNVEPGEYRVREVLPAGWEATLGYDATQQVTVDPVSTTLCDFGNFNGANLGAIGGTVWNDANADGLRAAGDPGLVGWTIFIDLNDNSTFDTDLNGDGIPIDPEPSAISDALGSYSFPSVAAGIYSVIEVVESGWNLSPGYTATVNATVVGDNKTIVDFANYTPALGSISGRVWNDLDGNGILGVESGLEGWTVFIDQNADGSPGAGEPTAITDAEGNYTLAGIPIGAHVVREVPGIGWRPTAPGTGMQMVNMLNGTNIVGINFGNQQRTDASIAGRAFADTNRNGTRDAGERGLPGITVWLDVDGNGALDAGEPSMVTSADLFYTPAVDEAGTYQFTHLRGGDYSVREILPVELSATLPLDRAHPIVLLPGEDRANVDFANRHRPSEIHGVKFDDLDGDHVRDPGEPGMAGAKVYLDLDRDDICDDDEPSVFTGPDGTYSFTDLDSDAYVVREIEDAGYEQTYPTTTGGILWPAGTSNPAVGNVSPTGITVSLAEGASYHQTVSLTLPTSGALTNMVDVFLLFDDTGSFTGNSPIVRAAFPQIIADLQAALPGIDLGFGVGRLEEYANFASEYGTGRPFILNQPIVAATTAGFQTAIQAALNRTAPGYGGDQPETTIEALYQLVTGRGFDGNNNGSFMDSGAAGLASTQLNPGTSGDVPPFASFTVDLAGNVLPAAGTLGGAGFRAGALPIILTATDTGFAYQPIGELGITGLGGVTLPLSALTQTSRASTPFNSGAGIQQTITALNALGALVIGLGTNGQATLDPRQGLEAIALLTGATNQTTGTIANGTPDAVAPGDPFYFQISSGFASSVANGIVAAIQNAVTNVAVNITLKASDPRVHIISAPTVVSNVSAGQTATFDVEFVGDGIPHRFDLQFVREGTNVVLGSIPVVLGTPIPGDGYGFEDMEEGEIEDSCDFGAYRIIPASLVTTLPAAVTTTAFSVGWSAVGGAGGFTYDVLVSDNGGPFTLWLNDTPNTSATFTGESFHTYAFFSVATDNLGAAEATPAAPDASTLVAAVDGTVVDDELLVRVDPTDAAIVQIFRSADPAGTPAFEMPFAQLPALGLNARAGSNHIILDFTAGSPIPAGGLFVTSADGNDLLQTIGDAPGSSIEVSSTAMTFGDTTVTYTGIERIALSLPVASTTLNVSGGAVELDAPRLLAALNISGAGHVALTEVAGQVLRTQTLTMADNSVLDLAGNAMVVSTGILAEVTAWLASGRTTNPATRWQGAGIASSTAAMPANANKTLAALLNDDGHGNAIRLDMNGNPVARGDILVKYTWTGDANLDGQVDSADYFHLDMGFLKGGVRYQNGDFEYGGTVDGDDYFLMDMAFLSQTAVLAPARELPTEPVFARAGISVGIFSAGKTIEVAEPVLQTAGRIAPSDWPGPWTAPSPLKPTWPDTADEDDVMSILMLSPLAGRW